jgi:choline kinase
MKAVIIAAGRGSRIESHTNGQPKTLLKYGNETILYAILQNFSNAGIKDFVIVTGFKAELIENYLKEKNSFGLSIETVYNPLWQRGNGLSVLAASEVIQGDTFLLSMSDHLVSVEALRKIITFESDQNLLLVDRNITEILDEEDATKVLAEGSMIKNIGKDLVEYNCIDCGVFRLDPRFFEEMAKKRDIGEESISSGVKGLIDKNIMAAVVFSGKDFWIDIDTPEAYRISLKNQR